MHPGQCPLRTDAKQPDGLPADFVEELEKFVRQGKGLIVYAGENVAAEPYNRLLGEKHGLLPLPVKGFVQFATKDEPTENKHLVKLNRDSAGIPTYLLFKEDNYYKTLGDTTVWKAVELEDKSKVEKKLNPTSPRRMSRMRNRRHRRARSPWLCTPAMACPQWRRRKSAPAKLFSSPLRLIRGSRRTLPI